MNDTIRAATSRIPAYLILALSAAMPVVALSQAAPGAPATPLNGTQRITSNFKDQPIEVVADAVAAATGRIFILDPRVRAQVTLISYAPMTPQEFYQAFLSILQVHGFAAVPSGNVVKIIMDTNARFLPGNDLPDRIGNGSDEFVTQVIPVKNANANQLVQVLKPLSATYGHLASVPGSNTIVISDRASNVARIMKIISRVDQAGDSNIEVIPLQNSTAADLVRTLNALNGNQPTDAGGLATRIVADERSNSVLVSGEPAQRLRIATLIAHLDTPVQGAGDADVRYLQYADAEKIAAKLKEQVSGIAASSPGGAGGAPAAAAGGTAAADRNAIIVAEPETNALIITASPKMRKTLNTIIDQLDIPRAQVLLEAIIVDVNTNKSADLGVNWAIFSNEDGTNVPAGGFISPIAGGSIVNLAAGIVKQDVSQASALTGTTIGIGRLRDNGINFGAMIRALRTDDNANVIATPTATTLDNQETELKVAQEVPFITGSYASTGAGGNSNQVNPFTTIQRQEVGTILKITPKINNGTAVVMKIELESSELSGQQGDANSLITNKRKINTNVMIEDGGVIVLGGLIRDSNRRGESRVPFLGRIPLIGEAFKTRSGKREKTNLMVFLRPKILRDGIQTSIETNRKYNAIRNEQLQQGPKNELIPLLPFEDKPLLPPPPPAPENPTRSVDPARRRPSSARNASLEQFGLEIGAASTPATVAEAAQRLSFAFARRHGVLVQEIHDGAAVCACRNSATPFALSEVRRLLRMPVKLQRVTDEDFDRLLRLVYEAGGAPIRMEGLDETTDLAHLAQELPEQADLLESDDDAPIIRLINAVLTQAVKENASDIHIEPFENRLVVRFRVDGVLREVLQSKRAVAPLVVSRIKVMSKLDIAEKRLPQDGRISLRIAGRAVDVRVSTIPSGHGERVVLRLLDKQAGRLELESLGMEASTRGLVDELIHKPHGIILVTGPTGSGKTTTLYAALERLNDNTRNIMTVEDPIEYYIDGIGQTQVNTKVEMTFARGLRAILRQDPDVVMVGEIRDLETAQIAVQASLTGHLVLSTLHTNTAVGAVTRLRDMGIEPFLLSSSLIGVVAQRLVRVLNPATRVAAPATDYERRLLNVPDEMESPTLYRPGKDSAGYRGRTGIYELVLVDDQMRTMIHDGAAEHDLERYARTLTPSIRDDGRAKVLAGETTIEEVLRVTRED